MNKAMIDISILWGVFSGVVVVVAFESISKSIELSSVLFALGLISVFISYKYRISKI